MATPKVAAALFEKEERKREKRRKQPEAFVFGERKAMLDYLGKAQGCL